MKNSSCDNISHTANIYVKSAVIVRVLCLTFYLRDFPLVWSILQRKIDIYIMYGKWIGSFQKSSKISK